MKILKGFLILVILSVMCLSGISQSENTSLTNISDWFTTTSADIQDGDIGYTEIKTYPIADYTFELPPYWNNPDGEWYRHNVNNNIETEPATLLEWFKSLTLDEKVEIYRWWKYESVNLGIVSEYGELYIRLDKE